jgi:hypothetical protein
MAVSITPAAGVKDIASAEPGLCLNRNRKVIRLGAAPYRQPEPARCFNLIGRRFDNIKRAQLLIKKEESLSTGR